MTKLINDFKRLIDNDRLSHAYLFFGEAKEERFIFALSLANYLENKEFKPLEKKILEECFMVAPDEKGTIGIEDVKKINNFLYQKPVFSKKRTAIIRDADNLTSEAQNAVLKTVEDSPRDALLIFIAKDESSLLSPLASRLQRIFFPRTAPLKKINSQILKMGLEEIIENDKIDEYFESLIADLRKNPLKNVDKLREATKRLTLIKRFNTNKKLQLKCL
jgi:DNA polymerase-3 subunit delta'